MRFEDALQELRKGKKIRHSFFTAGDFLDINNIVANTIYGSSLLCEQWSIYEEPGKTFPEVFEAFKEGKKIKRKGWNDHLHVDKNPFTECLTVRDLLENDWEVID